MSKLFKYLACNILIYYFLFSGLNYGQEYEYAESKNKKQAEYLKLGRKALDMSKYDSSIYYFQKAAEEYNKYNDDVNYLRALIEIANCYNKKGNFQEAINRIEKIENQKDFSFNDYPLLKAELLHVKGTVYGDKGENKKAIDLLNESLEWRKSVNGENDTMLANTYNNIGAYYYYQGDMDRSIEYYNKAYNVALNNKKVKTDPEIAMYLQNIGIIYAMKGDMDKAKKYFEKNLQINKQLLDEDNPQMALIYLNIGRFNYLLQQLDDALDYLDKAEEIYIKNFGNDSPFLGTIFLNKGNVYEDKQDNEKALEYYKKAYQIYITKFNSSHSDIPKILNNIGNILVYKKKYKEALNNYREGYLITRNPVSRSLILRNLGNVFKEMGNIDSALYYYEKSINYATAKLSENHFELGHNMLACGKLYLEIGKYEKALKNFKRAYVIYIFNFGYENPNVSKALSAIGDYYFRKEQFDTAIYNYQKAIICNTRGFNDTNIYSNPQVDSIIIKYQVLKPLCGKAKSFRSLYFKKTKDLRDLIASRNTYALAIDIVDKIRSDIREKSKLNLSAELQQIYKSAINTCVDLYDDTGEKRYLNCAFKYSEKSRFAVLLAYLRDMEAIEFGGIPDSLQQIERELKKSINAHIKLIYDEEQKTSQNIKKIKKWELKLFNLNRRYDSLISRFEKDYKNYYSLKYNTGVVDVEEVQNKIDHSSVIIEYFISDSMLYTFLITKKEFRLIRRLLDDDFYNSLEFMTDFYRNSLLSHTRAKYQQYLKASYLLYGYLIQPSVDLIEDKRITIIPDGELGYLAFETLLSEMPDGNKMDYRNLKYLIRSNPVNYSYSTTILFDNHKNIASENKLLAIAPTYRDNPEIDSIETKNSPLSSVMLGPIFHSDMEVAQIKDFFNGLVLRDDSANEKNFKTHATDYNMLHMAMHTIINDSNPMFSGLIFSNSSSADDKEDNFLYTYELYNLNLNAHMAVLSACKTGYGKLQKGEGIMNLARGFTYAGVPSIIMTLWEVEDKSGAKIMADFYRNIKDGLPKDEALRKAKLKYLDDVPQFRAHPYFWSAYVSIGNTKPIAGGNWFIHSLIIVAILAVVLVSLMLYLSKRSKYQNRNNTFEEGKKT